MDLIGIRRVYEIDEMVYDNDEEVGENNLNDRNMMLNRKMHQYKT